VSNAKKVGLDDSIIARRCDAEDFFNSIDPKATASVRLASRLG
jgi:hypothetical protein